MSEWLLIEHWSAKSKKAWRALEEITNKWNVINTTYEVLEEMTQGHFESTVKQSSRSLTVYYNKLVTILMHILNDLIQFFVFNFVIEPFDVNFMNISLYI